MGCSRETAFCEETRPVPSRSHRSNALKPENKTFVVVISTLQLAAIVLVWLLAIVPAGLAALAVLLWKTLRKPAANPPVP
jgi:hypothetical protein